MTGNAACRWTVLRCKEDDFQQFLGVRGEEAAARRVKAICEIGSRAELDRDATARARWNKQIRQAYLQYQQQQNTTHHNQEM